MDWDAKKKEREKIIEEERARFLAMSDVEALEMSNSDRYQRMRYQREIEAAEWLEGVRRKLPKTETQDFRGNKRYSKPGKTVYKDRWDN